MAFYSDHHKELQEQFSSRDLADRMELAIVRDALTDEGHRAFIESRDFFFLTTVNGDGEPTVSYKGGPVGVVTVVDDKTIGFPIYDGNGMFLSAGNVAESSKIGLLFIDFETPNRVRMQATATVSAADPLMENYPGALLIVRATVDKVFVNCARYIHKHTRVEQSPYVPDADGNAPLAEWKRIDLMQDVLPPGDQGVAAATGGTITGEEYAAKLSAGDS